MSDLLHLAASPRGNASESRALATGFLDELRAQAAQVDVDTWDLWDGSVPAFGPDAAAAKMKVFAGAVPLGAQKAAWDAATAAFERFDSADTYVFSVPMWNHGVPYILKQLIDVISQPGLVFAFDPGTGYTGLLEGKRAVVVYTSAVYGVGRPASFGTDFQRPYLEDWLRWAGVTRVDSVEFRPNLASGRVDEARNRAREELRALAADIARRRAA